MDRTITREDVLKLTQALEETAGKTAGTSETSETSEKAPP